MLIEIVQPDRRRNSERMNALAAYVGHAEDINRLYCKTISVPPSADE
ncbi:hypothetical protein GHK63_10915 [Sinorhizobium meliloti]|nr:hypothetical protein [Sinorhizobium meliloti]MQX90151.1 hypothetical protein [Sinorhizobium meliloti]